MTTVNLAIAGILGCLVQAVISSIRYNKLIRQYRLERDNAREREAKLRKRVKWAEEQANGIAYHVVKGATKIEIEQMLDATSDALKVFELEAMHPRD